MATGERRWYIVGCYLAPGDGTTIRDVETAMTEKPRGAELIVAGDLNVYHGKVGGWGRDEEITAVAMAGLEDIVGHYFLRRRAWCRDQRKWEAVRQGRVVRSQTDYILGSNCRIFQNVAVWYPRHNSDHLMAVGCLSGASPREHSHYLGGRTRLPLRPPGRQTRRRAENLFAELRRTVPEPYKQTV